MDELTKLKKTITTAFKFSGFVIRSENSTYLAEQLLPIEESEREAYLTRITENLLGQQLETANVEKSALEKAIHEINHVGLGEGETVFSLIDAFQIPRFNYNSQSKKFERDQTPRSLFAKPSMKSGHLRQRYDMLLQKTQRHELFALPVIESSTSEAAQKFRLQYAENLLATSKMKETVILGLLAELKEGKFFVEDPTGSVELDLKGTRYHSGFFCEGCFVLAEGSYSNGVLRVDGMGFPPAEPASSSRAFFGTQNSWGGDSKKLLKYSTRLQEHERTNTDATIVFLSDVRLDVPEVMNRLRRLFLGYDACPPVAIVLMGPFLSCDQNYYALEQHMAKLAANLVGCEHLKTKTDLIFVPALDDPIAPKILPRAPLPEVLVAPLLKVWPRTLLATNPCRLQYCTQQIVVCRLDLMTKLCRRTLHFPDDPEEVVEHFARTLICQGHLAPLHPITVAVHWDYDAALWLYPLPDLVVMGDSYRAFNTTQHGCNIVNTGSFLNSKFAFKVYIPATRTIEDSEIPGEFD